jgi:hypothetical protein
MWLNAETFEKHKQTQAIPSEFVHLLGNTASPKPKTVPKSHVNNHAEHWTAFHNRIKPTSKQSKYKNVSGPLSSISGESSIEGRTSETKVTSTVTLKPLQKVSVGINKNLILLSYKESCKLNGNTNQVSTKTKGENLLPTYPSHYQLIANCKMKPS